MSREVVIKKGAFTTLSLDMKNHSFEIDINGEPDAEWRDGTACTALLSARFDMRDPEDRRAIEELIRQLQLMLNLDNL